MNTNVLPPPAQMMNFILGRWISKPIYVAAELCIADLLADGPRTIDELAYLSDSHSPNLYRVMRALASVGIFSEREDGRFELTPMAEFLKTGSLRSYALMFNSDWSDRAWSFFLESVKKGTTAFNTAHGVSISNWLEENPEAAEVFNEANAVKAAGIHKAIIDAYDFSVIDKLTDVGGGLGSLMIEILSANSNMEGVILDIPSVIEKTQEMILEHDYQDRCQAVQCDFFESIPSGSDTYIMSNILHDWSDEQCEVILRNCNKAMGKGAKLLILEMIISPGNQPSVAKLLDLEMLVITGGRERTEEEFRILLESSGFKISKVISTNDNVSIIEAVKQECEK